MLLTINNKSKNMAIAYSVDLNVEYPSVNKIGEFELSGLKTPSVSLNEPVLDNQVHISDLLTYLGYDNYQEENYENANKMQEIYDRVFFPEINNELKEIDIRTLGKFFNIEKEQISLWYEREMPVIIENKRQCKRGIRIDVEKLENKIQEYNTKLFNLTSEIDWDIEEGIKSPTKIYKKCRELGLEPPPSLSYKDERLKEWIKRYGDRANFMQAILMIGQEKPIYDRLKKIKENLTEENRVKFELNYFGAHTGRFSGSGFNVHSIPEEIRELFLPDEGDVMLIADYQQIEPRIMMYLMGMPTEKNIYEEVARLFYNWKGEGKLKEANPSLYEAIKVAFLTTAYHQNDWGLRSKFPKLAMLRNKYWLDFNSKIAMELSKTSHIPIKLPTGRCLHYYAYIYDKKVRIKYTPHGSDKKFHIGTLWGNIVSGTARDIFLDKLKELYINKVKVLFHIHDEFVISCKEKDIEKVKELLERSSNIMPQVPFPISVEQTKCYK